MAPATPATPARCEHRSQYGLGCARSLGHSGSHWLTANAEAARASLVRDGFFAAPATCTGCSLCDPREAAREEAAWAEMA